jgi:hypothetical protein
MATKVHPTTTSSMTTAQSIVISFEKIHKTGNTDMIAALVQAFSDNDNAMKALSDINAQLGFVEAKAAHEAMLPPELQNFNVLKEENSVAAALNAQDFLEAQKTCKIVQNIRIN